MKEITRLVHSVRNLCEEKGFCLYDTIYKDSSSDMLDYKIISGDFYGFSQQEDGKYVLKYKNCVDIKDFSMIEGILPALHEFNYSGKKKLPYFTAGLSEIARAIRRGEKTAVEGGPCLFGTDEVLVKVIRKNGEERYFDYNTGKSYLVQDISKKEADFRTFMRRFGSEVATIDFVNRKSELTPQEWVFLKFPFETARLLSAPLVIPIPDMSYIKYLDALLCDTNDEVKKETLEKFRVMVYGITDRYLDVIERLCHMHRDVQCEVVHERNSKLMKQYYKARTPYMEKRRTVRNLTGIPEKVESVKDYVSMPALPYYLYGIKNIVEVDSMDETDSFRKCRQAHKGELNLGCVLLPEFLSGDKQHTIFDAPRRWKEYGAYIVE